MEEPSLVLGWALQEKANLMDCHWRNEMENFRKLVKTLSLPEYLQRILVAAANGNPSFRRQYQLEKNLDDKAVIFIASKLAWFCQKKLSIIIQAIQAAPFYKHTKFLHDDMDMMYWVGKGIASCEGVAAFMLSGYVWNKGKRTPIEERIIKILSDLPPGDSLSKSQIHKRIRAQFKAELKANPKFLEEKLTEMCKQGKIEFLPTKRGFKRYFIVF